MRKLFCLLGTIISLIFFSTAHALSAYQSTQIVKDKNKNTLDNSIDTAFYHVLTKKSGLLIQPDISDKNQDPQAMVERYDYTKTPCEPDESTCYNLTIYFNAEAIHNYMENHNLTAWEGERPSTLIWLQKKNPSGLTTLNEYDQTAQKIIQQGQQRDMTVLFPAGDITDQQVMPDEPQVTTLEFLLSKYHTQQILHGMVEQDFPLKISWHLFSPQHNHNWESMSNNLDESLTAALDHIVNTAKVNHDNNHAQTKQKTIIEIKQLTNYEDFTTLANRLLTYSHISKVDILSIGANFFTLELTHDGSPQQLLNSLQNDTQLQSNIESPLTDQALSSYQWIPPTN